MDDNFDELLAKIQEESLRHYNEVELPRVNALKEQEKEKNQDDSESEIFKNKKHGNNIEDNSIRVEETSESLFHHGDDAEGFHYAAGNTYIYPSNYPVRKYQADIVPTALFHNTLVSLPTGLGKTFIAAVVMYNFYRWYPMGKVIFMAPTRPLVTQQLSACRDIMGIPMEDTVELTGSTTSGDRKLLWNSKRVFYLTPQVLMNDLRSNLLQASTIKCLVIDEAHRATKGYAYCQVVKILFEENVTFRILALSATPGTDANAVKEVIQNLHIEKLEIRSEDSEDVVEYSHTKSVIPIIVDLPTFLRDIWNQYMEVYENYVRKIRELKVLNQNVATMSKFQMLTAFRKFTSRPPSTLPKNVVQTINGDFTSCITLAHGRELLQTYGLRTFHSYFTDAENSNEKAASITRLSHDKEFRKLLGIIEKVIFKEDDGDARKYNWSHPKMEHLVSVVGEHFESKSKAGENTKAIIFCQYRLVVTEVYEIIKKFVPLAKPVMFIGQSSKEKGQGLPQKKQIEVMKMFRAGEYNVLVATSVAEEGLDIGDVDLIVSMETHRSPIKLVQRFGRTGRKRNGRCVVLLTSGAEVKKFNEVMSTQKNYSSIISAPGVRACLEYTSPRMIPESCQPKVQLLHIKVTKSDKRKQCDIRSVFGKFDTSKASVSAAVPPSVPGSAFLKDEELADVREELGSYFPNFSRLPTADHLWPRQRGRPLGVEEFASDKFCGYSDWLDWNNELQKTHLVGHSRDTEMLVELLQKASEIKERVNEPLDNLSLPPSTSLWSTIGPNQNQRKKTEAAKKTKTNVKPNSKSKYGLDIRECMANIPPSKQFISQDSTMDDLFVSPLNKKSKFANTHLEDIEEDVIIVNDEFMDKPLIDVLCDYPEISNRSASCALSKNKSLQSLVTKLIDFSFENKVIDSSVDNCLPDVCGLLEEITIEDVMGLNVAELPCMKLIFSTDENKVEKNCSIVELADEDSYMSTESIFIGIDDIINQFQNKEDGSSDNNHFNLKNSQEDVEPVMEKNVSPILSQRPMKLLKRGDENFIGIDDIINQIQNKEDGSSDNNHLNLKSSHEDVKPGSVMERNLSPILSQRPMKILKGADENFKRKTYVESEENNYKKINPSTYIEQDLKNCNDELHELDTAILNDFDDAMLGEISPIPSCRNQNPKRLENNQLRENAVGNDISPILTFKVEKKKNSQAWGKNGVKTIESETIRIPHLKSSTPKCVKKHLFHKQSHQISRFNLSPEEKIDKISRNNIENGSSDELDKNENIEKNDDNSDEGDEIWGIDQILGSSKNGNVIENSIIEPNPNKSPQRLSYYMKGESLYSVTQLVEKAMKIERNENYKKIRGSRVDKKKVSENKCDDVLVLNSSDDDIFNCNDSKTIGINVEAKIDSLENSEQKSIKKKGDFVQYETENLNSKEENAVGNSNADYFETTVFDEEQIDLAFNRSLMEISDEVEPTISKKVTNTERKSICNLDDDDADYFEAIDFNQQCINVACDKSKQETSVEMESPLIGNRNKSLVNKESIEISKNDADFFEITGLDEIIQNCLDDNFIENLDKSNSPDVITNNKISVKISQKTQSSKLKNESSCTPRRKLESGSGSNLNPLGGRVEDTINGKQTSGQANNCSTQFKSDYLSNEDLEALLKEGIFDFPITTHTTESEEISKGEKLKQIENISKVRNDNEIIDISNEALSESPLLLSFENRSNVPNTSYASSKPIGNDNSKNQSKFSFLSKSKRKAGLNLTKQSKELDLKSNLVTTYIQNSKQGSTSSAMDVKQSEYLKIDRRNIDASNNKNISSTSSKPSPLNDKSLKCTDDDSFILNINNQKRIKKMIVLSDSTDIDEDSFPSIHTTVQQKSKDVRLSKSNENKRLLDSKRESSFVACPSDSDDSADIFIFDANKKVTKSNDAAEKRSSMQKIIKNKKSKKKRNAFIENEAEVSGEETSSGKETSGLDSLDESFVDDKETENVDNTMMVAHYLQTVKNPKNNAGGYRIPELSESVMAREVYSQAVPMDHETYINDSFCVNETGSDEGDLSELEIAEKLLAKRKKQKRTKRKRHRSSSESDTHSESSPSKERNNQKKRRRRVVILDDSDD